MQPSEIAERVKALPAGAVKIGIDLARELYPYQANDGMVVLVHGAELPYQWEREAAAWAPGLRVVVGRGKDRLHRSRLYASRWDVLLVNYETARNDVPVLRAALRGRSTVLYCDEATDFKSHGSKTAAAVRALALMFPYRFAVTATPIQQGLEDIHGICEAMGFGEIVGTLGSFRRTYCIRERVDFYVRARGGGSMKRSKMITVGYRNVDDLRSRLEPWTIRRKRSDPEVAKHLPAVQMQVVRLAMTPRQQVGYAALLRGIQIELRGGVATPTYIEAAAKFAR